VIIWFIGLLLVTYVCVGDVAPSPGRSTSYTLLIHYNRRSVGLPGRRESSACGSTNMEMIYGRLFASFFIIVDIFVLAGLITGAGNGVKWGFQFGIKRIKVARFCALLD